MTTRPLWADIILSILIAIAAMALGVLAVVLWLLILGG